MSDRTLVRGTAVNQSTPPGRAIHTLAQEVAPAFANLRQPLPDPPQPVDVITPNP